MGVNTKYEGVYGEQAAVKFLEKKGFRILERNFRVKFGEADIIAEDGKILVFVEVKARESEKYGDPLEAITPAKAATYRRLAQLYVLKHRRAEAYVRFDVITVLRGEITHIENAF